MGKWRYFVKFGELDGKSINFIVLIIIIVYDSSHTHPINICQKIPRTIKKEVGVRR